MTTLSGEETTKEKSYQDCWETCAAVNNCSAMSFTAGVCQTGRVIQNTQNDQGSVMRKKSCGELFPYFALKNWVTKKTHRGIVGHAIKPYNREEHILQTPLDREELKKNVEIYLVKNLIILSS